MPKQLLSSERLMLPPLHRHWILLVRGVVPSLAGATLSFFLIDIVLRRVIPDEIRLLLAVCVTVAFGLVFLVLWTRWEGDTLTVTDRRVILEEGVFRRTSRMIPLNRVQDVVTTQTLTGRILDYGTIEIHTAGPGGIERFAYVIRPERVRERIFQLAGSSSSE